MEANVDIFSKTPATRSTTPSDNPDCNSRKVSGRKTTTTSDRAKHLSTTKPIENGRTMPHSLAQAVTYWINRRRQLERCQANHPRSYETFLRVKQSAGGSAEPPDDTWDNGQLYRLQMIRAQAARDVPRYTITEEDVDNYLIHAALSDRHRDITDPDVRQPDHSEH